MANPLEDGSNIASPFTGPEKGDGEGTIEYANRVQADINRFWVDAVLGDPTTRDPQLESQIPSLEAGQSITESLKAWFARDPKGFQETTEKLPGFDSDAALVALALDRGIDALKKGNYGIGAIGVMVKDGYEYVVSGQNEVRTKSSSIAHAEQTVIETLETIARTEVSDLSEEFTNRVLFMRRVNKPDEIKLVTSLEPCLMCTGRIIGSGLFEDVKIAAEDAGGGLMAGGREKNIPVVFQMIAEKQNLQVAMADIPESIRSYPEKVFESTREEIDAVLAEGGLIKTDSLAANMQKILQDRVRP